MRTTEKRAGFIKPLVFVQTLPILYETTSTNEEYDRCEDSCKNENDCCEDFDSLLKDQVGRGQAELSWENELESPRTPCYTPIPTLLECPDPPVLKSLNRKISRQTSLNETKLLITTKLKRTASIFTFDKHFEFIRKIGSGSFSTVYEAQDKRGGLFYAVKMSKQQFQSTEDRERFMREVQTVESLPEHPNVVKYFRCWQQDLYFYIQMELCDGGNLRSLLDSVDGLIPENQIWNYVEQVGSGLAHIHANGVVHLDIKPENVLIDNQGRLKIGDFSLAVPENCWDWEEGDGEYVAPELLKDQEPGTEADMYSFGAMIYEWTTGERLPRSIPEREHLINIPAGRSTALGSLMQALLDPDPSKRPTALQVLAWRESH